MRRWLVTLLWIGIVADALYAARFLFAMILLNLAGDHDDTAVLQLNHWNWVERTLVLILLPGEWPELLLLLLLCVALLLVKRGAGIAHLRK